MFGKVNSTILPLVTIIDMWGRIVQVLPEQIQIAGQNEQKNNNYKSIMFIISLPYSG